MYNLYVYSLWNQNWKEIERKKTKEISIIIFIETENNSSLIKNTKLSNFN